MKTKKRAGKKLTQKMSFTEVCSVLGVNDNDIITLWHIVKSSNSATLNRANQVGDIMGSENLELFRKWLYR